MINFSVVIIINNFCVKDLEVVITTKFCVIKSIILTSREAIFKYL